MALYETFVLRTSLSASKVLSAKHLGLFSLPDEPSLLVSGGRGKRPVSPAGTEL